MRFFRPLYDKLPVRSFTPPCGAPSKDKRITGSFRRAPPIGCASFFRAYSELTKLSATFVDVTGLQFETGEISRRRRHSAGERAPGDVDNRNFHRPQFEDGEVGEVEGHIGEKAEKSAIE